MSGLTARENIRQGSEPARGHNAHGVCLPAVRTGVNLPSGGHLGGIIHDPYTSRPQNLFLCISYWPYLARFHSMSDPAIRLRNIRKAPIHSSPDPQDPSKLHPRRTTREFYLGTLPIQPLRRAQLLRRVHLTRAQSLLLPSQCSDIKYSLRPNTDYHCDVVKSAQMLLLKRSPARSKNSLTLQLLSTFRSRRTLPPPAQHFPLFLASVSWPFWSFEGDLPTLLTWSQTQVASHPSPNLRVCLPEDCCLAFPSKRLPRKPCPSKHVHLPFHKLGSPDSYRLAAPTTIWTHP